MHLVDIYSGIHPSCRNPSAALQSALDAFAALEFSLFLRSPDALLRWFFFAFLGYIILLTLCKWTFVDQIGPLDQLADNCYTSGPKLALEPACGPAVTLQDAGVSAGGHIHLRHRAFVKKNFRDFLLKIYELKMKNPWKSCHPFCWVHRVYGIQNDRLDDIFTVLKTMHRSQRYLQFFNLFFYLFWKFLWLQYIIFKTVK